MCWIGFSIGERLYSHELEATQRSFDVMDNKVKHLEFIQGVVNRLSTDSFLLKGWSVVLVSALFALSASQ